MARTLATARAVFPGTVESTEILREAEFAEFKTGQLRLPVLAWRWMLRLTWMTGHRSQRQCRDAFHGRIIAVADQLERRGGNVLVVSHAGLISYLSVELRKRNFKGPKLRIPRNSTLYVFDKS